MQYINRLAIAGFILSLLILLQGCDKTWDEHYNTLDKTTEKEKVIAEMEKIPEISSFVKAVKSVESLSDLLDQNRLYTILAPKNETFEALYNAESNEEIKQDIIKYHFLSGKYKLKDFSTENLVAFNDKYLSVMVDGYGKVWFDGKSFIINGGADNLSLNGMIHIIDKPLIPLENLYQFFRYYDKYTTFSEAIESYTVKDFNADLSLPVSINNEGDIVFDSVFTYYNPYLYDISSSSETPYDTIYGNIRSYTDISDKDLYFTAFMPDNFDSAIAVVKSSPFLNANISDNDLAGPILSNFILNTDITLWNYITSVILNHQGYVDTSYIQLYFADLMKTNFKDLIKVSNGKIYIIGGMHYDLSWLIKKQGNIRFKETEWIYQGRIIENVSYSDNVDTVDISSKNIRTIFYESDDTLGYTTKYNEWVNFRITGEFYPVDYKIMVRGRNSESGTFKIDVDDHEIGTYDFSSAPSGDLDTKFDYLGTVSFTEKKTSANLKFTFINTHPGINKGSQYLWIREIMLVPILD